MLESYPDLVTMSYLICVTNQKYIYFQNHSTLAIVLKRVLKLGLKQEHLFERAN